MSLDKNHTTYGDIKLNQFRNSPLYQQLATQYLSQLQMETLEHLVRGYQLTYYEEENCLRDVHLCLSCDLSSDAKLVSGHNDFEIISQNGMMVINRFDVAKITDVFVRPLTFKSAQSNPLNSNAFSLQCGQTKSFHFMMKSQEFRTKFLEGLKILFKSTAVKCQVVASPQTQTDEIMISRATYNALTDEVKMLQLKINQLNSKLAQIGSQQ